MTNTLIVSLRDPYLDSDRVMPPIGAMSLHSFLLGAGLKATLTNDVERVSLEGYTHVAISCMTPQGPQAAALLERIGKRAVSIIGGPHATFYTEECVAAGFDHVVVGDGEEALLSIIKGNETRQVVHGKTTSDELNSFPLPMRDPKFIKQYGFDMQGQVATTMITAKGCPFKCGFCEAAGTNVTMYSAENVGRQLDQCLEAGFSSIMFADDLFAMNLKRVTELAKELKSRNMTYRCFCHAKTMTEEIAQVLADSGCIEVAYGAESGSQKILDTVNKKTTVKQNIDFIPMLNKYGIKVKAFMMLGLPGESEETIVDFDNFLDILMTPKFKNKFGNYMTNDFSITLFYPFKGTPIRDNIEDYDIILDETLDIHHGAFHGKGGFCDGIVSTSSLHYTRIREAQLQLRDKYKPRVIL